MPESEIIITRLKDGGWLINLDGYRIYCDSTDELKTKLTEMGY